MSQWGKTNDAANSVSWAAETIQAGSGKTAIAANNTALFNNSTPEAFRTNLVIGQFGVSKVAMQSGNTDGEGGKVHAPGWALRRVGVGGLRSVSISGGTGFANGETIEVSGGTVNATLTLTTNATGNIVSSAVTTAGEFPNTGVLVYTYNREQHLVSVASSGGSNGYNNTDYIVASNGTVDGRATITTNATGGFDGAEGTITVTQVGLWANDVADGEVTLTVYAANGSASNGDSAVLAANIATSTANGTVASATLGGRAGRVTYETLAVVKDMANSISAFLPNT